eukprot:3684690-Rhodomonas_salina.1
MPFSKDLFPNLVAGYARSVPETAKHVHRPVAERTTVRRPCSYGRTRLVAAQRRSAPGISVGSTGLSVGLA